MRSILLFDLPTETAKQRKAYHKFVKNIKKQGFVMMQESVYIKLDLDQRAADSTYKSVSFIAPSEGNIAVLCITEKQFSSIKYILGELNSDVIVTDKRDIEI